MLSANTVIHFTNSKEALKGILADNFRIHNCRETVALERGRSSWYIPMVSFCDIPLSEVKDHITKYGNYGIGMTRKWALEQRLNPVLYVAQGSMLSASYRQALQHFNLKDGSDVDDWTPEQRALADVLRYIKNYEGSLTRKGKTAKRYRFSDEREWRYVPSHTTACEMILGASYYEVPANKSAADARLVPLRLTFTPNDIKYIIIRNDDEITEFVDHLRQVKGKTYSLNDVERLTTRLLTAEQIRDDM